MSDKSLADGCWKRLEDFCLGVILKVLVGVLIFVCCGVVVDLHSTRIVAVSIRVASRAGLVASQRRSLPLSSRLASISNLAEATLPLTEYSDFNCHNVQQFSQWFGLDTKRH